MDNSKNLILSGYVNLNRPTLNHRTVTFSRFQVKENLLKMHAQGKKASKNILYLVKPVSYVKRIMAFREKQDEELCHYKPRSYSQIMLKGIPP